MDIYKTILEDALAGYWDWNILDDTQFLSPTFKSMFGYKDHEIPNKPSGWKNIVYKEDLPGILDNFEKHFDSKGKIPYYREVRYHHKNGSTVWVVCTGRVIEWSPDGKPLRMIGCHIDISEQKNIEQDLKISEAQFKGAFEYSAIGMALVSIEGKWLKVNKQLCQLIGYTEKELLSKTFQDITHPDDLALDLKQVNQMIKGKIETYRMEKRYFHKNGSIVWILLSVSLVKDPTGKPIHFVSQIEDITQRKDAEAALVKVNRELTAIFDSAQVSIISTDTKGAITHFSKGAENLLGYSRDEVIGHFGVESIHLKPEVAQKENEIFLKYGTKTKGFDSIVEIAKRGEFESRQWTYVRKDKSTFPVQLVVTPVKNDTGEITGFLGIATDITEREENKQRLTEAKDALEALTGKLIRQNKQLANFAYITSHNLRSPVSNLNSLLNFYKAEKTEEKKDILFTKFEVVVHHLSNTLNELIKTLKIKDEAEKKREIIYFEDTLRKIKEIMAGQIIESDSKINCEFSKAEFISYNKGYLESIFLNLLSNAIKYRSDKRKTEIHIKTYWKNEEIIMEFSDNGLGLDIEKHGNKLFGLHKTFHKHEEAKGIGLFITKTQVEAMGGEITVTSKVDKGTTFKIIFNKAI